jgi:lipopolysaccharide transport system permease protein
VIIFGLTRRDFRQAYRAFRMNLRNRYLGSHIGFAWAVLNPLILMLVYVFVFGFVMKVRVSANSGSMDYLIWFISGFAPWLAISEGIASTANAVTGSINLVKSFPIKTEILPISFAVMGLPQLLVGIILVMVLSLASGAGLSAHIFWFILIIPLMFAFLIGLGFFLATITVFIRDLNQMIGTILMFLLFFSPIFYTPEQLPSIIQKITFFNPIFQIVDPFRRILLSQQHPDGSGILYLILVTAVLWFFGLRYFRTRKGLFESVL